MAGSGAGQFMAAPDEAMLDPQYSERPLLRRGDAIHNTSQKFIQGLGSTWKVQYAQIYFARCVLLHNKNAPYVKDILSVQSGHRCYFIGTLFKDMKAKPNILEEYNARENYEAPPPERSKYCEIDDQLAIEDHTGRALLSGAIPAPNLVSGVIVAVLGKEDEVTGDFVVEDYCCAGLDDAVIPRAPSADDKYIALMSGLNVGRCDPSAMLHFQICMDFLTGECGSLEDQQLCANISRVLIAGNLIGDISDSTTNVARYKSKGVTSQTVTQMKEVDDLIAVLASSIPVDFMAGPHDPTNFTLPQQPLHRCLFPFASAYSTVHGVSNPYSFDLAGVRFLGTSGQGVDDIFRYSELSDRLDILGSTLEWRHLFPTSPDTLGCFPFSDQDPFVIKDGELPHVYFAGNQPEFGTRVVTGINGAKVTLVCVPRFDTTSTIVLLNLRTLECVPMQFSGMSL